MQHPHTIREFDEFVAAQSGAIDYELIDGEIVAMANRTETHEQIASNIGARLKLAMDKRGCRTYQGGMRIQAGDEATAHCKCKPDIVVRCGPSENKTCLSDPVVVIEVLSPSTIDHDRGKKLMFYKSLATLHDIVLAYSDQRRVEHYFRDDDEWRFEALVAARDVLYLEILGFQIGLEDVYFDLAF